MEGGENTNPGVRHSQDQDQDQDQDYDPVCTGTNCLILGLRGLGLAMKFHSGYY